MTSNKTTKCCNKCEKIERHTEHPMFRPICSNPQCECHCSSKLCRNPNCTIHSPHNISYEKCIDFNSKHPFNILDSTPTSLTNQDDWEKEWMGIFSKLIDPTQKGGTGIHETCLSLVNKMSKLLASERSRIRKLVEGRKITPTKHDRHTLDDTYCYDCGEIMEEGTEPNGAWKYNQALKDILDILKD